MKPLQAVNPNPNLKIISHRVLAILQDLSSEDNEMKRLNQSSIYMQNDKDKAFF
jgi:hypothetical protein